MREGPEAGWALRNPAPGGCSASGQQNSLGKGSESGGTWLWLCAAWGGGGGSCLGPARGEARGCALCSGGCTSQNAAPAPKCCPCPSLHRGAAPEERAEPRHLLHDAAEPARGPQPLPPGRGCPLLPLPLVPCPDASGGPWWCCGVAGAAPSPRLPSPLPVPPQFCKHQERETLKDLYNQDDNHQELGNFYVHSSYSEKVCARRGQEEGGGRVGGSSLAPPGPWQRPGHPPWGEGAGGGPRPAWCLRLSPGVSSVSLVSAPSG